MVFTSQIRYVNALDTSVTTGAGKTGLAFSDITAKYLIDGGTLTSLTTETITTLGTYQAPTSSAHIRIKELSSSDPCKGAYEVHFHNTQLASGTKLWLFLSATGAKFQPLEVALTRDITHWNGTAVATPATAGIPDVNAKNIGNTLQTGRDIGTSVLVGDKTGFSLATTDFRKLLGFKTVTWIDTTDNSKTVIEAATAGTLCILGPGTHTISAAIARPAGVSVRGCGKDVTYLVATITDGTPALNPRSNTETSDLTIVSLDQSVPGDEGSAFGCLSSQPSYTNALVRDARLVGCGSGLVAINASPCSLTVDNVDIESGKEGLTANSAAHLIKVNDLRVTCDSILQGGCEGLTANGGAKIVGQRVTIICRNDTDVDHIGIVASGAGSLIQLSKSTIDVKEGPVIVESVRQASSGEVRLTDCEFDRSRVNGTITDIFTPATDIGELSNTLGTPAGESLSADIAATSDSMLLLQDQFQRFSLGRTWYVSKDTGSDITGRGTREEPFQTYPVAEAQAEYGDTIQLFAETWTDTDPILPTKSGIWIRGMGRGKTIINHTDNEDCVKIEDNTLCDITISDMTMNPLITLGVMAPAIDGITLRRLDINGTGQEGFDISASYGATVDQCNVTGGGDGCNLTQVRGALVNRTRIRTAGSYSYPSWDNYAGIHLSGNSQIEFRNCILEGSKSANNAAQVSAIRFELAGPVSGSLTLRDCQFLVSASNASQTGGVRGLYVFGTGPQFPKMSMFGGSIKLTNANGSAPIMDIEASAGGIVRMYGTICDPTRFTGDVKLDPSRAEADAATAATNTGTLLTNVAAVPTADQNAIALLAKALAHGSTVMEALEAARALGYGKLVIDTIAKTMKLYAPDETTVLVTHDLTPTAAAATTRNPQ